MIGMFGRIWSSKVVAVLLFVLLLPPVSAVGYKSVRVKPAGTHMNELFEWGVNAIIVDNMTVVYSFPYDFLYMGIYRGGDEVTIKPLIGPCVCNVSEFLVYNGSLFFVSNDGPDPHSACDEVVEVNPNNMSTRNWILSWDARERVNPEKAGNIPYVNVDIGLDRDGRLWARAYLLFENETLYYLYSNGNFTIVNATPSSFYRPKPQKLSLMVQNGSFYVRVPVKKTETTSSNAGGSILDVLLYGAAALTVIVVVWFAKRR